MSRINKCVGICVCVYLCVVLLCPLGRPALSAPHTAAPTATRRTPHHTQTSETCAHTSHTITRHPMRRRHHVMSQCCRLNEWGRWTAYCSALGWREAQPLPCVACVACVSDLRYVTSLAVKWKPSRNSNACTPHHTHSIPGLSTHPSRGITHRHTLGIGLV
jgi:hypothetical protein